MKFKPISKDLRDLIRGSTWSKITNVACWSLISKVDVTIRNPLNDTIWILVEAHIV